MSTWSLLFDVAFDVNPGTEPAGGDWTDLSARVRDQAPTSVSSGSGRLADGAEGTAGVTLDNADRLIDPSNPDATLNLVPMRHARLRAVVGATTYPLFRGFVKRWPPIMSSFDSTVRVEMADGFSWLGTQDADIDLPKQMSHERITALLDAADWPAELRDIGDGVVELEAHEQVSANLLQSLRDAADAEDGDLYCAPDGKITFRSRHARFNLAAAATFGTSGIGIAVEPAPVIVWDEDKLSNVARVELEDGSVCEAIDDASALAFGKRVMPTRDLALRKAEAQAKAQWDVVRFAETRLWIDALMLHGTDTGALEAALPRRIGELVNVLHDVPDIDTSLCIERWRHEIRAKHWSVWFDLSPYFGAGPWFRWDDPANGWDSGAVWAP